MVKNASYGVIEPSTIDAAEAEDTETLARLAEVRDKRHKLVVAIVLGLPLLVLAMARDFGLIALWLIGETTGGHTGMLDIWRIPRASACSTRSFYC